MLEKYYLDVQKIFDFCSKPTKEGDFRQKEIVDTYGLNEEDEKIVLEEKTIREVVTPPTYEIDESKFNFICSMVNQIFVSDNLKCQTYEELPLSSKIAFNTLKQYDFLKIVK